MATVRQARQACVAVPSLTRRRASTPLQNACRRHRQAPSVRPASRRSYPVSMSSYPALHTSYPTSPSPHISSPPNHPALHILSSPPHLLSSPLLWRGSGAGPSARARWYSCCSSAACCPEAAHRPRRLRQRRAPASRARQTSRRPGAACPTAWPKCENERPLRRSDACPKS